MLGAALTMMVGPNKLQVRKLRSSGEDEMLPSLAVLNIY